ncbi:hypothetical protein U1Q18_008328 [Sarracenia purpurea var. burkii]
MRRRSKIRNPIGRYRFVLSSTAPALSPPLTADQRRTAGIDISGIIDSNLHQRTTEPHPCRPNLQTTNHPVSISPSDVKILKIQWPNLITN